jgi:hypothetical protein
VTITVGRVDFQCLVDLGMLPVQDIPQLSKLDRKVLLASGLVLELLQEALASGAGQWD